ncbi:MAG: hypothetical protein JNL74_20270 [Fibrobacteres bacterium]|nr:hypothetical protein [Fibrobacterota bacterium]
MQGIVKAPPDLLDGIEKRLAIREKRRFAAKITSVSLLLILMVLGSMNYSNYKKSEELVLSEELLLDALMIVNNPEDELITVSSTDQNYYFQGESK